MNLQTESDCTLFQATPTDRGICWTANSWDFHKLYRTSSASEFAAAFQENFFKHPDPEEDGKSHRHQKERMVDPGQNSIQVLTFWIDNQVGAITDLVIFPQI